MGMGGRPGRPRPARDAHQPLLVRRNYLLRPRGIAFPDEVMRSRVWPTLGLGYYVSQPFDPMAVSSHNPSLLFFLSYSFPFPFSLPFPPLLFHLIPLSNSSPINLSYFYFTYLPFLTRLLSPSHTLSFFIYTLSFILFTLFTLYSPLLLHL